MKDIDGVLIMDKVTICGFGNVGKSLVHQLSKNFEINVLTFSNNKKDKNIITVLNKGEREVTLSNTLKEICTEPKKSLKNSDILIITMPNFLREETVKKILPFLHKELLICFIPGIGPSQFIANKYLKDYKVICLERVPYIVRTENEKVKITGDRKIIKYASLDEKSNFDNLIKLMFGKDVQRISYSSVTLTSSNAILHTARMFSLFENRENKIFKDKIYFYSNWDDESSEIFQKCDNEIMKICEKLKENKVIDEDIISLMKYYESETPQQLTWKLRSIEAFKNIKLSMLKIGENQYVLDKKVRFLTEDIPFGLLMFKGLAEILEIKTPSIDKVITWAQEILEEEYIKNHTIVKFKNTGCPQNFGIFTIEDLKNIL